MNATNRLSSRPPPPICDTLAAAMLQPGAKVLAHRNMYDKTQSRVVRALADGIFLRFEKR